MYTPRASNLRPIIRQQVDASPITIAQQTQDQPARKPARRLTRNPVLAGIVNNAMRLWK